MKNNIHYSGWWYARFSSDHPKGDLVWVFETKTNTFRILEADSKFLLLVEFKSYISPGIGILIDHLLADQIKLIPDDISLTEFMSNLLPFAKL